MRLLLVAPEREEALDVAGKKKSMAPPLNLAMVAAATPSHWEIRIADANVEAIDFDAPVDLVGIGATTRTANRAYEIATRFRQRGLPVVLGGIHPSTLPDEAGQYASSVVIGEAEHAWPELLRDFEAGHLKPTYQGSNLADMAELPIPRRDLYHPTGYLLRDTLFTTRGCPYSCNFCTVTKFFGRTYRLRPVDAVLRELDTIRAKTVYFVDDNIVGHPKFAQELFKALIPRKLKWAGQSSLAIARDEGLLSLAAASGCMGLFIGFESTDEESLRAMGKRANLMNDYYDAVRRIHRHGIAVFGAFVFGFDQDDESVFERTVRFARQAKLEGAQFNVLTPYPGTAICKQLEDEGRLLSRDWSRYNMSDVVYVPKKMTPETLRQGHDWAWEQFYSIPSIVGRLALRRHNIVPVIMLNLIYRHHWYGKGQRHENPRAASQARLPML